MRSLNIGATGMLAQQLNVEVISNNIANMNTTGFKRHRAEFQDLLYQNLRRVGSASSDAGTIVPTGVQLGLGVTTVVTTASLYVVFIVAAMSGSFTVGILIGATFGLVRALPILTTADARDPSRLRLRRCRNGSVTSARRASRRCRSRWPCTTVRG